MKLKYYMRGLGIGMLVTAFILSVVIDKDTKTMSDEEVRARAKELGMVESTVLSQMASQNRQDETEADQMESETADTESVSSATEPEETQPESEQEPEKESETQSTGSKAENETQSTDDAEENKEPVTIVITPGESSETVSRSLEEAGLVANAKEFDRFLCDNGYDKRISVGTYKILQGTPEEEIAKIISKSR